MAVNGDARLNDDESVDDRLAQFRKEWPRYVSWAEVRAEDPSAFRSATKGALLIVPAGLATLAWLSLGFEFPMEVLLPDGLAWMHGLLLMAAVCLSIVFWLLSVALISMPWDARRGIAIARFASHRGLHYSRYGFTPERQGVLLAEGRGSPSPRRSRTVEFDAKRPSLFRANFALMQTARSLFPPLQIAIAGYTGGKNDPRGPRTSFRYMEMSLPRILPHIMIDARGNGSLKRMLPGSQILSFEGDFDRYFSVYVPKAYERDALELLTPDVMLCLIDHGRQWDVEIVDDKLVVASRRFRRGSDRAEYTAMLYFSELMMKELGRQAATYSDPRAARPRSQVSSVGTRLRRRSALWGALGFALFFGFIFAFPIVLGWLLDS